jgi:hypothetical protein
MTLALALPLTARHPKATMAALSEACSASNPRRTHE